MTCRPARVVTIRWSSPPPYPKLRVPLTKRLASMPPAARSFADGLDSLVHLTRQAFADIVRRVTYRFCRARDEESSGHSQPDATRLPVM